MNGTSLQGSILRSLPPSLVRALHRALQRALQRSLLAGLALHALAAPLGAEEFPAHHLFVSCLGNDRIVEFDEQGFFVRAFGDPELEDPTAICFGPNGRLYAASFTGNDVLEFTGDGESSRRFLVDSSAVFLDGMAFGPGGLLHVSSSSKRRIYRFDVYQDPPQPEGFIELDVPEAPNSFAFGPNGHVFAPSRDAQAIFEIDLLGNVVRTLDGVQSLSTPVKLAFGPSGHIWSSPITEQGIVRLTATGSLIDFLEAPGASNPDGLAFGPDGALHVCMRGKDEVWRFDAASGLFLGAVGIGEPELQDPSGIAFAPARFEGRIAGKLSTPTGIAKVEDEVVISIAPGSRQLLVELSDDDLVDAFQAPALALHGFENFHPADPRRAVDGLELRDTAAAGHVRAELLVKGSFAGKVYVAQKARGSLVFSNAEHALVAKLKTTGRIN